MPGSTIYVDRCSEHRGADAGWRCSGCKRLLCSKCTAKLIKLYTCCHCDAPAAQLTEPRVNKAFLTWLIDAIVYPIRRLHVTIFIAGLVGALIYAETQFLGGGDADAGLFSSAWLMQVGKALVAGFAALSIVATSARRLNAGHLLMLYKTVASTCLLWAPALVYVVLAERSLNDEIGALLLGLTIVYVPAALASSATDVRLAGALSPFVVFSWLWRVKWRYTLFVVWTALLGVCAFLVWQTPLELSSDPMINEIAGASATIVVALMAARLFGTFVYVHGDAFDWGPPEDYADPIFPDMKASGMRKGHYLDGDDEEREPRPDISPEEVAAIRRVEEHIRRDRPREALGQYEKRSSWHEASFDDRQLLTLGRFAMGAKKNGLAVELFERAVTMDGIASARALYQLARLHETVLEDPERAQELYRSLVEKYPQSEVALQARKTLETLETT